ncbi:MAG: nitroreductase family protein [Bdellovibrionaceae bacterium]|nr:nitroreductase family protein [Bdellovibrio sp.]
MEFFEVVEKRRSIRKYSDKKVPTEVMNKALDAALLAPNSSNLQTWQFHWVHSEQKKKNLAVACLSQGSAESAQELLVVSVRPSLWKKTSQDILSRGTPAGLEKLMQTYYGKLIPFLYGFQILAPFKWLIFNIVGILKPTPRKPWSLRDREEICIKSAALACQNFMLAITAQDFDTCPMEGFDESRIKKILNLKFSDRIVMVISVGERVDRGVWGERYRSPRDWFIHEI